MFGLGPNGVLNGPVARGELGQVWRLATTEGRFAVKEPFDPPEESATDDEAAFQDLGVAAGVPAPKVIRTTAGRTLGFVRGTAIRVYEWVELERPDRNLDPVAVGTAVARLHKVQYSGRNGLHAWYTEPVGRDAWRALVKDLATAHAPFADEFAARIDDLIMLEQLITPPADVQTCHRDLFADNVLATVGGGVCVIDWENSGLADPSQELAVVLFEFGAHDVQRAADLYGAYREVGGKATVDRPESFSMAVAQLGHIGQHAARRWLADIRPEERERSTARVEEFLCDGITPTTIEALLDAVGR